MSRRSSRLAALWAVSCLSCSVSESVAPAPPVVLAKLDREGVSVEVDASGSLTLARGGAVLVRIPSEGLALGRVGSVRDDVSYDPFRLVVPSVLYAVPGDLTFITPKSATLESRTDTSLRVRLVYDDREAKLDIDAAAPGRFDLTLTPEGEGVAFMRLGQHVDRSEGFYGLGESFDDVDQRGKVRAMQLELESHTESPDNEAHVPIPLLIGTTGWGLFVNDAHPGVFEVATKRPDLVEATFGTGVDSPKGLHFHLFAAEHPLDLTRHYYDLTGYPRLPGRFGLGPVVWRDENTDQAQVVSDVTTMRALDLPASAIWIDRPYATAVNTFDFEKVRFPDPKAMIATAHSLGFRVALWHTPYLDEKSADAAYTASLRAEAEQKGLYPVEHGLTLNHWGPPLDLTNPDAVSFWQSHLAAYTGAGIEGFKLDYGEDVLPGATEARNVWRFSDGSDERTMHGRFQLFYHSTYASLLPKDGGFLLCRHATIGDQTNGSIIWPGDLDATFARVGDPADDGSSSYVSVGGLPASVIAGLSLGPSGFPFYGADTGGYRHAPPDGELFIRWFEQTALSTVMQIGNGASTVAWELGDDALLTLYRRYTRLHLRLFPYEWTYAQRLAVDGRPIVRPLGLAYPELGVHPNDEYTFGDDLLVAPVLDRGAIAREVVFPRGRWMDWWTGETVEGGGTLAVSAPLDTLPLYLREGAIVPLLRPTIDTIAPTTDPIHVDSFATTPGILYARVFPGPMTTSFTLYDGTELSQSSDATSSTLSARSGSELGDGFIFELPGFGGAPLSVTIDDAPVAAVSTESLLQGSKAAWLTTNDLGGTLWVRVDRGAHRVVVTR